MVVERWSWAEVWQRRLQRHCLAYPAPLERLEDVVAAVCGIHAQVAVSAEVSLGVRIQGATRHHIRDALWRRRSLVKTYCVRGTLHLLPAKELSLWLAALRAKTPPRPQTPVEREPAPGRRRAMPPDRLVAVVAAIEQALEGWRAWLPANAQRQSFDETAQRVHLMPRFDCYVVGSHPRDRLIPRLRRPSSSAARRRRFRSCSSTAWSPDCGTHGAVARSLMSA